MLSYFAAKSNLASLLGYINMNLLYF